MKKKKKKKISPLHTLLHANLSNNNVPKAEQANNNAEQTNAEASKKEEKKEPKKPEMDKTITNKYKNLANICQGLAFCCKPVYIGLGCVSVAFMLNPLTSVLGIILGTISLLLVVAGTWVLPEMKDAFEETELKLEKDVVAKNYKADYQKYIQECYDKGFEPKYDNDFSVTRKDKDSDMLLNKKSADNQPTQ